MTLESLGPLVDELCAVLHGKGCTVREVSVTYSPLAKEDVPASWLLLQKGGRLRQPAHPTMGFQASRQVNVRLDTIACVSKGCQDANMRAMLSMVRSKAGVSPQCVMTPTGQRVVFSSIIFAGHRVWMPRVFPYRTFFADNASNPCMRESQRTSVIGSVPRGDKERHRRGDKLCTSASTPGTLGSPLFLSL